MAILHLANVRARFGNMPFRQRAMFAVIGFSIFVWMAATSWLLTQEQVNFIAELQIDKLVHFMGGVFTAGLFFAIFAVRDRKSLIFLTLAIGVAWELWEVLFLPDQLIRFQSNFLLWLADSFFDLVADVLGAYFFAEITKNRPEP